MNLPTPRRVFCSHRSVDKPEVQAFAARLRAAGIDAWFADWEVQPGDDFVARINEGLDQCHVGLAFFSSKDWPGRWFDAEVSTLTLFQVEQGRRLIPVMIDECGVHRLPALLLPYARRGVEDFDQIVTAILGGSSKPPLGPVATQPSRVGFTLQLDRASSPNKVDIMALRDGKEVARNTDVALVPNVQSASSGMVKPPMPSPPDRARALSQF